MYTVLRRLSHPNVLPISLQVTFLPKETETLTRASKEDLFEIELAGKKQSLYTHSYLGLGLMSGRLQTLGGKEGQESEFCLFTSLCHHRKRK